MASIDEHLECHKTETDLFHLQPVQTSIVDGHWVPCNPISSIGRGTSHIEFHITGEGNEYLDLNSSYLKVVVRVVDTRGGHDILAPECLVGGTNNLLHSLFSTVTMSLGEQNITTPNSAYPYRAYLEKTLSYGQEAKKTYLQAEGYYKDGNADMDPVVIANNKGFRARRDLVAGSREVELKGRLHLDMFQQPNLLLNGVSVRLTLHRSKDAFALQGTPVSQDPNAGDHLKATFGIEILDATLEVRKVALSPRLLLQNEQLLQTQTAKYPIRRVVPQVCTVSQGRLNTTQTALFSGQIPSRITLGAVTNRAYNGVINLNPFNFQHFHVSSISLLVGGKQVPVKPLAMDYEHGKFLDAYLGLFTNTGQYGSDEGNMISREDYAKGYTLYCFNLAPDLNSEDDHTSGFNRGDVELAITFAVPVPETINIIALAEYDNTIQIDRYRNVILDYPC